MIEVITDADGIRTLTWNQDTHAHNLLSAEALERFSALIDESFADSGVRGLIIASAKASYVVGADLDELRALASEQQAADYSRAVQTVLRRLESGGKPVVAALNGSALGGGLELALACHRRIAADVPDARFGLPEATLGLLPGGGGTQRLPRMIGVESALPYLLQGLRVPPARALADGLVDELCASSDLLPRARAWLLDGADAKRPWDRPGFAPSIDPRTPAGAGFFLRETGRLRAQTWMSDPARQAILSCVHESTISSIDAGLKLEQQRFAELTMSAFARNTIRTSFYHLRDARRRASRLCAGAPTPGAVAVIGAGMMGAGIATACADAGVPVCLIDRSLEAAARGRAYAAGVFSRRVAAGELGSAESARRLALIQPAADDAVLADVDLMVEAVFEDRAVKAQVYTRAAAACGRRDVVVASNTSTLPITGLAAGTHDPSRFIGLHFFSPVDRMPLVEVIRGERTSDDTLARALRFVRCIGKTPIVVRDARGFYTSRVFSTYVREGLALLGEGVAPALIENAGRLAGMPVGPLAVLDEISAELVYQIARQTERDLGSAYRPAAGEVELARLVTELDRPGRKYGRGVYDYPKDVPKRLWPGLSDHFALARQQPEVETVSRRLMYIQSVETVRCLQESVLLTPADGDLGAVLGWGYPVALGGPLAYIDQVGAARFVEHLTAFGAVAARYAVPEQLLDMARRGQRFFEG